MKKIFLLLALLLLFSVSALETVIANHQLSISYEQDYSVLESSDSTIYQQDIGAAAIPQLGVFLELPSGCEVQCVNIIPLETKKLQLSKPLLPVQQPVRFSADKYQFTQPNPQFYDLKLYPASWLNSYSQGNCGSHTILSVSLSSVRYDAANMSLEYPSAFEIRVDTAPGAPPTHSDNHTTAIVLNQLGISSFIPRDNPSYLVIAPQMFQNALQPLRDWRTAQGYDVYFRSTGEISENYEGEDLAAKIRTCISDMQQNLGIDYVTLAGDHQHIPARYAFAFDCEYGAHAGENDLACDMYYSCLDGDWNADADTLYGEDEDEVDLYPEVFVGRIPANTALDITSYTSKLIQYEKGEIADYNLAGGLSMELWVNSLSEICQQYIYDNYFPSYYDIEFLYGDENSEENAFALLSAGKNIVQHTGHGWINVMSLENYGHIYSSDVANLTNEWGGIFYSIGCWCSAFDHTSIAEIFVREPGRNFLGFIGNSSYGWGAPSAPGFGFSEFYQREFFRLLFADPDATKELGAAQALQKLAFLPYYSGTSVYKWVGYELNLMGDAAARLFTDNPRDMQVFASHTDSELYIQVMCEDNLAIEEAVINSGDNIWQTGSDGIAVLPWQTGLEYSYGIYADGFRYYTLSLEEIVLQPVITIINIPQIFETDTVYSLELEIINPALEEISFYLQTYAEPEEVEISYNQQQLFTAPAGGSLLINELDISLDSYYNFPHGNAIDIYLFMFDESAQLLARAGVSLSLHTASLVLKSFEWTQEDLVAGEIMPLSFTFQNLTDLAQIELLEFEFYGDDENIISYQPAIQSIDLQNLSAGEEIEISTNLNISSALPDDFLTTSLIEVRIEWDAGKSWHSTIGVYLGNGNLQIEEDLETPLIAWEMPEEWQRVTTFAYNSDFSLSCRPAEIGNYLLTSPILTYTPGSELSFWYRCKMPVYGEDGFSLKFVNDYSEEAIIFLGSGGALASEQTRLRPDNYLETEWIFYRFNLDDVLLNTPSAGENYQLVFDFFYSEIIENFSDYATMPEIGIFIDDLVLQQTEYLDNSTDQIPPSTMITYPNPYYISDSRNHLNIKFSLDKANFVDATLYDIRGRKQFRIVAQEFEAGIHTYSWQPSAKLSSGIYLIRLKYDSITNVGKILFLH